MEIIFDAGLVIKLAATAALVLTATLFAERFGAFIGAIIASMPLSAGPAYFFIAIENGPVFLKASALTSLAVHPMTAVLLLVCSALVLRFGIVIGLGGAMLVWAVGAFGAMRSDLSLMQAVLLNVVVFVVVIGASRSLIAEVPAKARRRSASDVLFRVMAVVAVVGSAIIAGRLLGPQAAGLTALVPVIWISMAVILCVRAGPEMCSAVLANGIVAMIGFSLAFAAIYLTVEAHGLAVALGLALVIAVGWNLGLTAVRSVMVARATER